MLVIYYWLGLLHASQQSDKIIHLQNTKFNIGIWIINNFIYFSWPYTFQYNVELFAHISFLEDRQESSESFPFEFLEAVGIINKIQEYILALLKHFELHQSVHNKLHLTATWLVFFENMWYHLGKKKQKNKIKHHPPYILIQHCSFFNYVPPSSPNLPRNLQDLIDWQLSSPASFHGARWLEFY